MTSVANAVSAVEVTKHGFANFLLLSDSGQLQVLTLNTISSMFCMTIVTHFKGCNTGSHCVRYVKNKHKYVMLISLQHMYKM